MKQSPRGGYVDRNLNLEIVTPYGPVASLPVEEVYLPGSAGDLDVLPGHAPLLTTLRIGEMRYRHGKELHLLAISRGFGEVTPEKVTVLADSAEAAEEIDLERARSARARAEEKLQSLDKNDPAYPGEIDALERAATRIRVAEKIPKEIGARG